MKRFAALYTALDATTSTNEKLEALTAYFSAAEPDDAAWAVYFLAGGKPRQSVPTRMLTELARERAGLPEWLFDESYQAVGDLAETIAHVLPPAATRIRTRACTMDRGARADAARRESVGVARTRCSATGTNSTGANASC